MQGGHSGGPSRKGCRVFAESAFENERPRLAVLSGFSRHCDTHCQAAPQKADNGNFNSTAQINYAAEGTMGARYDSTGLLIEGSGETGPMPVFGDITRTLTGSGNAVAHADSYSLRFMDNYYDSFIIDQHMVINSNETFEGSKEQETSPEVVTNAESQRYVGNDVDVTGLILVGGTRNTSDHVIVWHNGAPIYDETVGDFDFYADSEPDFGFRDTYDTVGFLATRVGPTHGPGGDEEQMFTSATTFTGDTPGSTGASWVAFVGEQQEGGGTQEPGQGDWVEVTPRILSVPNRKEPPVDYLRYMALRGGTITRDDLILEPIIDETGRLLVNVYRFEPAHELRTFVRGSERLIVDHIPARREFLKTLSAWSVNELKQDLAREAETLYFASNALLVAGIISAGLSGFAVAGAISTYGLATGAAIGGGEVFAEATGIPLNPVDVGETILKRGTRKVA